MNKFEILEWQPVGLGSEKKEEEKKKATREKNEVNMNEWRQKVEGLKRSKLRDEN